MDSLIPFLKHSSALDLLIFALVVLVGITLIVAGIWIALAARNRTPIYIFLVITFLPLLLGVLGTYLRFWNIERVAAMFPESGASVIAAARQEAMITTYAGAVGTLIPALIAVVALVLKKDR